MPEFVPPRPLETAVLLLIFNRPDTTKKVFEAIRKARPPRLYISADGPRSDHAKDATLVEEVRDICQNIDWPCEVHNNYSEHNLGCKAAVIKGIDWFFKYEECGIILEDDCLPNMSFFWFCQDMLIKYEYEPRVMHIAGMCYKQLNSKFSYNFVRIGGIWGWATWKRAWHLYDHEFSNKDHAFEENILNNIFYKSPSLQKRYKKIFSLAFKNTHTWDYQWTCTKLIHGSVNIMPSVNLVENIGLGHHDATHTSIFSKRYQNITSKELKWPLMHRNFLIIDQKNDLDNLYFSNELGFFNFFKRVLRKFGSIL
ncbi:hypothetical protein N9V53_05265 [Amylibacter sp.]|nr:hypothetical protein [Amylibacter sp.]MDB2443203.1 hypothetical protein [Amylibacter sp.]